MQHGGCIRYLVNMSKMRFCWLAIVLLALPAAAQEVMFYKCTDASGHVTMQNDKPCGAGMKQEIRRVGEVKTVPVPAMRPKPVEPPSAPPQYGEFVQVGGPKPARKPAPEAASLPLPPALYQCSTWQGDTYYGETAEPPSRCMPLPLRGINGDASAENASACEIKRDQCAGIPEEQLCAAWYRRLDDAEFKLRYTDEAQRRERQQARDNIVEAIKRSRCATEVANGGSDKNVSAKVP